MKHCILFFIISLSFISRAQESNYSLFEQIGENDIIEITYHSSGCFGSETKTITIQQENGSTMASYSPTNHVKDLISRNQLHKRQIDVLKRFETELKARVAAGPGLDICTSTSRYIVKVNGEVKLNYTDGSCSEWNPMKNMEEILFAQTK